VVHVIALVPSSGYRRVVVERQAAGGSVAAVESVLQVDPRLADDVVGPDDIVVQHHHDQLRLQREGHREFKDPERRRETVGRADRRPVRIRCRQTDGYRLSERGVELFGDVSIQGARRLLSGSDHQVRVGFAVRVRGSQRRGLQDTDRDAAIKPGSLRQRPAGRVH